MASATDWTTAPVSQTPARKTLMPTEEATPVTITRTQTEDDWANHLDNCPARANPDQVDANSNGIGDPCDPDPDSDGVANQGLFRRKQVIASIPVEWQGFGTHIADFDSDGDPDVLVKPSATAQGWRYDAPIVWYENTDGMGTFGAEQVITPPADENTSIYASDLDSDGDMDVLSGFL